MYSHPLRPLVVRKSTLPLPLKDQSGESDRTHHEEFTKTLLAMAENESLMPYHGSLLLRAIDPATGDSVVHRAGAAGNIKFLDNIMKSWGRNAGESNINLQQMWLLATHQNLAGDTALHSAARADSLKGVKATFRFYHWVACDDVDDSLYYDETTRPKPAGNMPIEPPVEYWDEDSPKDDPDAILPELDFVCTKNRAGRDAAGEARAAGHETLAIWLDRLVSRLDREGKKDDKDHMRKARLKALEMHFYADNDEGN